MPKKSRKAKKPSSLKYVAAVLAVLIIAVLGYSLYVYYQSGAAEQGIIVCGEDGSCVWQAHIHAYIVPVVCGVEEKLPIEVNELEETHTHEEKNTIHFHASLPYDKSSGEIIDKTPLKLGTFFDGINVRFTDTCFMDKCSGDLCNGKPGTLKVFANTEKYWEKGTPWGTADRNYVWSDRDIIYIAFDERSGQETAEFLRDARIEWPVLGVG
ncbi:MAG: hypothetical protein HYW26_03880 [Candidatus Aenigmarchaeota archaeon]|nr:hypothetical protein [Candidatus Aenigmarchaeota archaeon]